MVENAGSSILMEIPVQQAFAGLRFETLSQRVEIPDAAFVDLEIKELDRGRTFAAVALVVAAVGGLVLAQFAGRSGGGARSGPGGPEDVILPLPIISIPVFGIPWIR